MLKKLAMATLAVGALALNVPAAHADAPTADCRLRSVQQDTATGPQQFVGVLAGVAAHPGTEVKLRCYITVDDVLQTGADTLVQTGNSVVTAQKDISFNASDTAVVKICTYTDSPHGGGTTCQTLGIIQVPPQVVYDTLDSALAAVWPIVDPVVCSVLQQLAPGVGPVVINSQGDVYVNGEPQYDCPPYDIVWG